MGSYTEGATKNHVEIYVLRALSNGECRQAGELKDWVAKNAPLPAAAKLSLAGRSAERQSNNTVQNVISQSRKSSLTGRGFISYDAFRGCYKITASGRIELASLETRKEIIDSLLDDNI